MMLHTMSFTFIWRHRKIDWSFFYVCLDTARKGKLINFSQQWTWMYDSRHMLNSWFFNYRVKLVLAYSSIFIWNLISSLWQHTVSIHEHEINLDDCFFVSTLFYSHSNGKPWVSSLQNANRFISNECAFIKDIIMSLHIYALYV